MNNLNQSNIYDTTFVIIDSTHPQSTLESHPKIDLVINPYNFNYEDKRTSASWVDDQINKIDKTKYKIVDLVIHESKIRGSVLILRKIRE